MIRWLRHAWFKEGVVTLVCSTLVLTPFLATMNVVYADEVIDEANKGQDTGANLLLNYQVPTINNGAPGDPLGANEINIQELFPGYDPANPAQITDLSDLSSNPEDLSTQGVAQQFLLQGGTGETADAYQSIRDGSNNPNYATIDMRNDNFLDRSRDILSGTDPILNEILTACAEDVTAGDPGTDTVTRLEDIWTCSQLRTGLAGACTVERDFILVPVATQVVLTVVAGGVCTPATGNDLSDWNAAFPTFFVADGPSSRAWCRTTSSPVAGPEYYMRKGITSPFTMDNFFYPYFCGERDTYIPSNAECEFSARQNEHACRNALPNGPLFTDYSLNNTHPSFGPVGTCATYAQGDPTSFNGLIAVDYTGCDQNRINYCTAVYDTLYAECTDSTCGGGLCADIDVHGPAGWSSNNLAGPAGSCHTAFNNPSPPSDWVMLAADGWVTGGAGLPTNLYFGPGFCGDFETYTPTLGECNQTALYLMHACRNSYGRHNPARGPIGTCSGVELPWPVDPLSSVDYTGCDANLISYCTGVGNEYYEQCARLNCGGCGSGNDIDEWGPLGIDLHAEGLGPVPVCEFTDDKEESHPAVVNNDWWKTAVTYHVLGDWYETRYALFCGQFESYEPTPAQCSDKARTEEWSCRHTDFDGINNLANANFGSVGSCTIYLDPDFPGLGGIADYTDCDADRQTYCTKVRDQVDSECIAPTCSAGGGSAALLTGTETIVSPGLGPGYPEILANQNVFGTTVDFEETGFNPGDYGLIAGEYIVADHTVAGTGLTASTIDDGGSYGSNWDYTTTLTLVDSPGFTVEATLYQIANNGFIFTGCSQSDVQNVDSGVCTGSITCSDYTPPCRTVDGVQLCENPSYTYGATEVLVPWSDFTSTIPEMCWFADVDIVDCVGQTNCIGNPACVNDCADLPVELQPACQADPCWVDAQGNTICLDDTAEAWVNNLGDPNYTDDCKDLMDRPECTLTPDVSCVEGMEDASDPTNVNLCLLRQRFFDCGTDVTVPGTPGADDSDITCEAEIRCFGDECANTLVESNPDFGRAAVAATTVTESTKDMTCDIQGDPLTCRIFDGADNRCKDPRGSYLGLIPDCCEMAKEGGQMAGNFWEYMQLARVSYRLAKDPMVASWLAQGSTVQSGLQAVVNAPGNIASAVKTPIVNGWNSVMSWAGFTPADVATQAEALGSTVTSSVTGFGPIQSFIAGGVDSFLRSIGAEAFADSLFTVGADGAVTDWAADGFGEMVGNVFAVIGLIYTIYSVLKILGSIFFACEEEELAFGIQLVNRACHHVGTYCSKKVSLLGLSKCVIETQTHCCFSSPFARIMNEQLREQGIGPDWGTAKEPNCEGIQISELENVDWDLVDLSEWEAIIFQAGLVPDPRNPPLNFIPTDLHPGDSLGGPSGTNEGATSTDINQDTINLIMDTTDSNRFSLETAPLTQPDPELMPWY